MVCVRSCVGIVIGGALSCWRRVAARPRRLAGAKGCGAPQKHFRIVGAPRFVFGKDTSMALRLQGKRAVRTMAGIKGVKT
jgi:hypothetical protein